MYNRYRLTSTVYDREDEIDAEKERLQEETRCKLQGSCTVEYIMKISFEIVWLKNIYFSLKNPLFFH